MPDDPYRTLGLERGASLDEVKRAYRRLVKANHPDAAGEAALPRFLAIQAAYDEIVDPDGSARRIIGRGGSPGAASRRPWEADSDRAGATYRAYGGRPRPRPGARPGPRPRPSGSTRPGRPPGDAGTRQDRPPDERGQPGQPGERRRKKATLGSTSYDDVDPGAFSPDWGGASWYGTTSGTYWTINPKEYADPRKHGPEYQARARRAEQMRSGRREEVAAEAPSTEASEVPPAPSAGVDPTAGATSAGPPPAGSPPPPTHTTSSWWDATTGDATSAGASSTAAGASPRPRPAPSSASTRPSPPRGDAAADLSTEALIASIRGWLDDDHPTSVARIGRAVVAWAPIALGGGWLAGEVSGCGRFAATCSPTVAPLTWIAQLGLLLLLILLPRLARIGTIATIAILGTVFPASLLLFATADPASAEWGRSILGGLIILAWVVGLGFGIAREARRATPPVS